MTKQKPVVALAAIAVFGVVAIFGIYWLYPRPGLCELILGPEKTKFILGVKRSELNLEVERERGEKMVGSGGYAEKVADFADCRRALLGKLRVFGVDGPTTLGAYKDNLRTHKEPYKITFNGTAEAKLILNNLRVEQLRGGPSAIMESVCQRESGCVRCTTSPVYPYAFIHLEEGPRYRVTKMAMPGKWAVGRDKDGNIIHDSWEILDSDGTRYWYVCRPTGSQS